MCHKMSGEKGKSSNPGKRVQYFRSRCSTKITVLEGLGSHRPTDGLDSMDGDTGGTTN